MDVASVPLSHFTEEEASVLGCSHHHPADSRAALGLEHHSTLMYGKPTRSASKLQSTVQMQGVVITIFLT